MERTHQLSRCLFAAGMIGLGIRALIVHDFAMQWQPVPQWVPARAPLAIAAGVLMLACGIALLFRMSAPVAVRVLFPYLILWQCLKLPDIVLGGRHEAAWLGFAEISVLLAGGWTLFAQLYQLDHNAFFRSITGAAGVRMARILFAIALIPIGLSHLVYVQVTAGLVPAWLHFRTALAYITGIAQMACGLGVLFSVFPRLAATVEAAMIASFTLLVWLPRIISVPPGGRLAWTAFLISWVIGAAAFVVAQSVPHTTKSKV